MFLFLFACRRIYVDTRLHHLLDLRINQPFFDRGDFPAVVQNGSEAVILQNPWVNGTKAAPFDQRQCVWLSVLQSCLSTLIQRSISL